MKIIIKPRASGKTTGMIYTSESTGYPIIVQTYQRKKYIIEQAESIGCIIPYPLTVEEIQKRKGVPMLQNVLIDEAENIISKALDYYLKSNVVAVTFSSPYIGEVK